MLPLSDRAQALYEAAQTQAAAGRPAQAEASYQELAKLKVTPWSQMAERRLADLSLAPGLAQVGR